MLPSRGLLRAFPASAAGRRASPISARLIVREPTAVRRFGSSTQRTSAALRGVLSKGLSSGAVRSAAAPPTATLAALSFRPSLLPSQQARHASTQPASAAPAAAAAAAATATPDASPSSASPDLSAASPVELTGGDLLDMPEQIGYLHAMGLDYGWGPTAMMQWVMEHLYIYTGMPWWACLATFAVAVRAAIFLPSLSAAEQSHRMQELRKNPRFAEAVRRMQEAATVTRDQAAMMAARAEMRNMQRAAGVQMWKSFVPLVNVPIAFGMLRLFRGMAALPVPSLETGGALWFPDLTVPDPLFILPVASSVLLYLVMKMNIPYMAEQQAKMMKLGAIIMGPLSLIVTIYFPAGLQFFFLVTGALQYLQTWLFYRPWLRRWANLPPLKPVAAAAAPDGPRVSPFSGGAAAATSATWQAPRTISTSARPVSSATDASEAAAASGASLLKQGSEVLSSVKSGLKAFQEKVGASAESKKRKKELEDAQKYEERRRLEEEQRYYARKAEWEMKRREKRP